MHIAGWKILSYENRLSRFSFLRACAERLIGVFYETKRGESPVYEFFKKQQSQARAKITHLIDLLSRYGNMLGLPHSKALGGGLYELRIRGKEELRIFYCFTQQKTIYLLHAFKKQTQETPTKELNLAVQRKEEAESSV